MKAFPNLERACMTLCVTLIASTPLMAHHGTGTVADLEVYAEPWTSDVSTFHLASARDLAEGTGWASLAEDKCVPFDEVDEYNRRVRDPAGGVVGGEQGQ